MLTNFKKNCLGTLDFTAQFDGMRKPQEFCVYPMNETDGRKVQIQSDSRFGVINLEAGKLALSASSPGATYVTWAKHLFQRKVTFVTIPPSELAALKDAIRGTGKVGLAGTGPVYTDNSGALQIV